MAPRTNRTINRVEPDWSYELTIPPDIVSRAAEAAKAIRVEIYAGVTASRARVYLVAPTDDDSPSIPGPTLRLFVVSDGELAD